MKKIVFNILIVLQVLFFTSCLTTKQTNLLREPGGDIPSYPLSVPSEDYRVKQGDRLQVSITTNPLDELTTHLFSYFSSRNQVGAIDNSPNGFSVNSQGTIYFPYVGDIYVQGKTTLEIRMLIEKKINESISDDCIINVSLENRYYSVVGEAGVGRYPIAKEQMTIFQALAQSRDVKQYGDRSHVKIIRQMEDGTVINTFDLRSKDVVNSEFYYVQPNDVIYVQPLGRQFLGLNSFGSVFAVISTVLSFGFMVYRIIK